MKIQTETKEDKLKEKVMLEGDALEIELKHKKKELDREVRILREDDTWELSNLSKVRAGDHFRIYEVTAVGFVSGQENEYVVKEYEAFEDAKIGANGSWEVDCFLWEDE